MYRDHAMVTDDGIKKLVTATAHRMAYPNPDNNKLIEGMAEAATVLGIADTPFAFTIVIREAVAANRVLLEGIHTASKLNADARRRSFDSCVFAAFIEAATHDAGVNLGAAGPTEAGNDRMHA